MSKKSENKKPTSSEEEGEDEARRPAKPKNDTVKGMRAAGASALARESERLQVAAMQKHRGELTDRLSAEDRSQLPSVMGIAFGTDLGNARFYRKLPVSMGTADLPPSAPRWRIEVEGLGPGVEPVGLDIIGDSVIGRGRVGSQAVDFDLDQYGGLEQGVSRRHTLLRPTANHLYIIDLGSTNGTMHNGLPLGPGIARAIKHNDTITLGRLSFTIKIIDGPGMHRPEPIEEAEGDSEPTRPLTPETGGAATPYIAPTETGLRAVSKDMVESRRQELENKDTNELKPPA